MVQPIFLSFDKTALMPISFYSFFNLLVTFYINNCSPEQIWTADPYIISVVL